MKRLSSWALPIILGVAGVALIIVGSFDLDFGVQPTPTLPSIRTPTPVAQASPTATPRPSETAGPSATPEPT